MIKSCPFHHDRYYPRLDCKQDACYCECEWCMERKAWNRGNKKSSSKQEEDNPLPATLFILEKLTD